MSYDKTLARYSLDPNVFKADAISDETAKSVEEIEALLNAYPDITQIGAEATRTARKNGEGGVLAAQPLSPMGVWRTITENNLDVPVRIFKPETINGIYLHIHGGGHTIGSADAQDQGLAALAIHLNLAVISVEYRLAPENPWPAAPDDCEAVACWLVKNSSQEFGSDKIVIGGESAGAHLCAVTLLRMRDKHAYTGFIGANLVYGIYDFSMTPSLRQWGERRLIINTPICAWFFDNLLPPKQYDSEARRDPDISPLYADLKDMPPALFTVGTLDPILDDSLFMASAWQRAGNQTILDIYPGGIHAFNILPITIAQKANANMVEFIKNTILN